MSAGSSTADEIQEEDDPGPVDPSSRGRTVAALTIAALVLIVIAAGVGWLAGRGEPAPTEASAAAGFARDMQTHHEQAVEMAMSALTATDDPEVRQLAYDIATSQSQQAGQLYALLNEWGLPQRGAEPPMAWMLLPTTDGSGGTMADHGMAGNPDGVVPERMPGLATSEQLAALHDSTGLDAERRFLTLMIAHHEGGVAMAQAVLQRSDQPVITAFARAVVTAQVSEIAYMRELLAARGGPLE